MATVAEAVRDSESPIPDDYVHAVFERYKDSHFERILMTTFARGFDLADVLLTDQFPKGQRPFAVSDAREFLERMQKQELNVHFTVARHNIAARDLTAPAMDSYLAAWRELVNTIAHELGERAPVSAELDQASQPAHTASERPAAAPLPASLPREAPLPACPSLLHMLTAPLWGIVFPLPVLLGWMNNLHARSLLGIALFTSVAFMLAPGRQRWPIYLQLWILGSLLNGVILAPLVVWEQTGLHLPMLLPGPHPWLLGNASLWGIVSAMGVHLGANLVMLILAKRAAGRTP